MECIEKKLSLPLNEVFYITPIGDVHADASAADLKKFEAMLDERLQLPNSYFLELGDAYDWICPGDHRYRRGNDNFSREDAFLDRQIEHAVALYRRIPPERFLAMGSGNHALKVTQKLGTDPAERVARELGVPYSRYSGRVFIKVFDTSRNAGTRASLRILWHHGAWGGDAGAGFSGALRWARGNPGWDVMLYGHNHASMVRSWDVVEQSTSGFLRKSQQHLLACGTFLRSDVPGQTTYSEKAGYGPVFIGCPLLKCKLCWNGVKVKVETGGVW